VYKSRFKKQKYCLKSGSNEMWQKKVVLSIAAGIWGVFKKLVSPWINKMLFLHVLMRYVRLAE
jgi:hypothetical protein